MIGENIQALRKQNRMTQELVAEKIGVSRQAVAKWEAGETLPDIDKAWALARLFGVSLDDMMDDTSIRQGMPTPPPRGKHIFGVVTLGEKGQVVIPQKARKVFGWNPGDRIVVLGDENQGIALMKEEGLLCLMNAIRERKDEAP